MPLKHAVCLVCEVKEDNSFMYLEFSPDQYELNTVAHLPTPARELALLHAADVCSEKASFPSIMTPNPSEIE